MALLTAATASWKLHRTSDTGPPGRNVTKVMTLVSGVAVGLLLC